MRTKWIGMEEDLYCCRVGCAVWSRISSKKFLGEKFHWGRKAQTHDMWVQRDTLLMFPNDLSNDLSSVGNRGEKKSALELMRVVLKGTSLNNWHLFPARKSWNTIHNSHLITLCRLACSQKRSVNTWNRGKVLLLFTWKTLSMLDWEYSGTLLLSPGK